MKKVKGIIGVVILLVFAFVYAHIAKMNMIYDKTVENSEYQSTGWGKDNVIEQSFISSEKTLDGINLKCQTTGDVSKVSLCYTLEDVANEKVVATGKISASELESTKFNKIIFDTVENSKNKEFLLTVWNEGATDTDNISFYYQPQTENGTELMINEEKTEGTLILKTITNRFDFETFCVFLILIGFMYFFMKVLYKLFK